MEDKLLVFEIAMGKKPIGPKLDQMFTRHVTILRILLDFFCSINSSIDCKTFFKRRVRYTLFFAEMEHEDLGTQLSGVIKGGEEYRTIKDVLDILYFVGNSRCQYSEAPFYNFDSKRGKRGK